MPTGLAWTALLMGLAGGPHCAGMCGAACGGLVRVSTRNKPPGRGMVAFQAGRLLGYATVGGLSAFAVQNLLWLTRLTPALHPIVTLFDVVLLVWGLTLLVLARQPLWVDGMGRRIWARWRLQPKGGRFWLIVAGAVWALMPCGLLYSALFVASLSGGPLDGARAMALFALGSGLTLAVGPWLWLRLQAWRDPRRQAWGMRVAGASLAVVAAWALAHEMNPRVLDVCRTALGAW